MRLLLTGFEPFGGDKVNPSQQVVQALAERGLAHIQLCTAILPVDRHAGPAALLEAVREHEPDVALCLGLAASRVCLSIERVAVNLMDYRIADNSGNHVVDEPIVPGGPAAYFATVPVRAMLAAVQGAAVPAELSLSAGAFLCNQVMYTVLHYAATNGLPLRAGFVHLPLLPEQVTGKSRPAPSMSLATMVWGVEVAIGAL